MDGRETDSLSLQSRIANYGRALTAKELAELLNVSPVTVFKQAKKGLIPSFRIGTCVRFEPTKRLNGYRDSDNFKRLDLL
jgi:excisionase family DNA binding protein